MKVTDSRQLSSKAKHAALGQRALTTVDLLVVLVVFFFAIVFVLPRIAFKGTRKAPMINCANNLKQIGLSFRQFATDNNDRFPQQLGTNEGGCRELVLLANGKGDPASTFWVFATLSNELSTPKMSACPGDRTRPAMSNFAGVLLNQASVAQGRGNAGMGYFVNLTADEMRPQELLAGDRNFSTVTNARRATDYDAFFGVEQRFRPDDVNPGGSHAN